MASNLTFKRVGSQLTEALDTRYEPPRPFAEIVKIPNNGYMAAHGQAEVEHRTMAEAKRWILDEYAGIWK